MWPIFNGINGIVRIFLGIAHESKEDERHSATHGYLKFILFIHFLFFIFLFFLLLRINSEVQAIKKDVQVIKSEIHNNANNPPVMQSVTTDETPQEISSSQIDSPQEDNNSVTDEPSSDDASGVIQAL